MEMMIALTLMGIFLSFTVKIPSGILKNSKKEAPIILMGCLNEEMREAIETMENTQLRVDTGRFEHRKNLRTRKRVLFDEEVKVRYQYSTRDQLVFGINTDFTFRINDASKASGPINFIRHGKIESELMIHFSNSTMDLRLK